MGLLDHQRLAFDQVSTFLGNDFAVHDESGQAVAGIRTEGGLGSRMILGNRHFSVADETGMVLQIHDTHNLGRDRFELADGTGTPLGQVVKQFSLFHKRLTVELADGTALELRGNWRDLEFAITGPGGDVAVVEREWAGVMRALRGRSRYGLTFNDGVPAQLRLAVIGAVVAVDLIRAKEEQAAASSSTSPLS